MLCRWVLLFAAMAPQPIQMRSAVLQGYSGPVVFCR
jgi:hypothetical protein